jgi:hypothetical protein
VKKSDQRAASLKLLALAFSKGRLVTFVGESNPPNDGRLHAQGLAILAILTRQIATTTTEAASCRRHSGVSFCSIVCLLRAYSQYTVTVQLDFDAKKRV